MIVGTMMSWFVSWWGLFGGGLLIILSLPGEQIKSTMSMLTGYCIHRCPRTLFEDIPGSLI